MKSITPKQPAHLSRIALQRPLEQIEDDKQRESAKKMYRRGL